MDKIKFSALNFLLGLNIAVFIAILIFGGSQITNSEAFLLFGAFRSDFVLDGMIWQLLTSTFVHFGLLHIVFNMMALLQIGRIVEQFYTGKKLFILYVFGGIAGSLATLLWALLMDDNIDSVGASGAIFALLGLLIGGTLKQSRFEPELPFSKESFYPTLAFAIIISFMPNINWAAHLGGLLVGITFGYFLKNNAYSFSDKGEELKINILFYSAVGIFAFSYVLLVLNLLFEIIKV